MTVHRLARGWRLGFVVGGGMVRIWTGVWVVTLVDRIGPSKAN